MSKRKQLFDLWESEPENKLLFDCRLVAVDDSDQEVHASRCNLAASSEYFKRLFTSDGFQDEAKNPRIPVPNARIAVLRQAIAFVMSDGEELQLDEGIAASLLELGDRLQMQGLVDKAGAYLQEHLAPSNAADTYLMASKHSCEALVAAAGEFVAANLAAVASQSPPDALQQLTVQHQLDILRRCTNDVLRSTAALDWIDLVRNRGCTALTLDKVVGLLELGGCSADELLQLGRHTAVAESRTLQLALMEQLHARAHANCCSLRPDSAIRIDPWYAFTARGIGKQAAVWHISDWASKQEMTRLYSPPFCIEGMQGWTAICYPKGYDKGAGSHLSLFLRSPRGFTGKLPALHFSLFLANQNVAKTANHTHAKTSFAPNQRLGFSKFLPLQELASTPGFVVDDELIVGVNAGFAAFEDV